MGLDYQIIAEVKTSSPFNYSSERTWDQLFDIADRVGDILSIHTDDRWGGSFDAIRSARSRSDKPILAKGIHSYDDDISRAVDMGADMVLVVGRIPEVHLDKCLIEPYDWKEVSDYPPDTRLVWNARNLHTGKPKGGPQINYVRRSWKGWLCQASMIRTVSDVSQGVDAVLVGTHLEEFAASLERGSM